MDADWSKFKKVKVLDVCLVGAGRAGNFHVNSILKNPLINLVCVVDKEETKGLKLAEKANSTYHNNIEYVLKNYKFDALIIASTTNTHYPLTIMGLKNNKHIFCEKPLGTIEEIDNCYDEAEKRNLNLMVAYQKRFDKNYKEILEIVKDNKPTSIKSWTRDYPIPPISYLKTSNGIVHDMISHDIDICNFMMNFEYPKQLVAFKNTFNMELKDNGEIENIEVLIQYESGEIININGSRTSNYGYDQRLELTNSNGLYIMKNEINNDIEHITLNGKNMSNIKESFPVRYKECYYKELEVFYDLFINGKKHNNIVKREDIILNNIICEAIEDSIKNNKIINISKNKVDLRNYKLDTDQYYFYKDMHEKQTLKFVQEKREKYSKLDNCKMTIRQALELMDEFIDPSDPDLDLPNSLHAYQTAERIRKKHPKDIQLQVCGLIHDLGKVLFKFGEPSYCVVGDTFPLGCKFQDSIVYYDTLDKNPDNLIQLYKSKLGIYEENCGISNLNISFGHDEYLYLVLKNNKNHKLEEKYWDIIRFHSFYPWHTGNDYHYFMDTLGKDKNILDDVLDFNSYDLYSKEDTDFFLTNELKEYYYELLDVIFPEELNW